MISLEIANREDVRRQLRRIGEQIQNGATSIEERARELAEELDPEAVGKDDAIIESFMGKSGGMSLEELEDLISEEGEQIMDQFLSRA